MIKTPRIHYITRTGMGYSFVRNRNLNFYYNTKLPPASSLLRQRLMIVKQVNSIKKTKDNFNEKIFY